MTVKIMTVIPLQTVTIQTVLPTPAASSSAHGLVIPLLILSLVIVVASQQALPAATTVRDIGVMRVKSVYLIAVAPTNVFVMILLACQKDGSVVMTGQGSTAQQKHRNVAPRPVVP